MRHTIAKRYVLLIALAGGSLLAVAAWASHPLENLLRSLQPGAPNAASASTEPYDLTFKVDTAAYGLDEPGSDLAEWRLTLPRAFVWSEDGDSEDVGGGSASGSHRATLFALFDPATETFSPAVLADRDATDIEGFFVDIGNYAAGPNLVAMDRCVRRGEQDGEPNPKLCTADMVRCRVQMHSQGWGVGVAMPKQYYEGDYRKYCGIVSKFLKKSTISIDDLRRIHK